MKDIYLGFSLLQAWNDTVRGKRKDIRDTDKPIWVILHPFSFGRKIKVYAVDWREKPQIIWFLRVII